jgi:hypothetical protein
LKARINLLAMALILSPLNCCAIANGDQLPIQEQQAKMDTATPTAPARPLLNGSVSASQAAGIPADLGPNTPNLSGDNRAALLGKAAQFLTPSQLEALRHALKDNPRGNIFTLSAQDGGLINLNAQQPKLSNEQFRQMEYGVVGLVSTVTTGDSNPIVTEVFPGCPAQQAGIKVGDMLIAAGNHVFRVGDGQRTVWQTVGGKAGTNVKIKVLRDGELITFDLVRMNFEDIPDPSRRAMYELYLSRFGPPTTSP